MADLWEQRLHVASFGGLELDVISAQDDMGRDLAVYSTPHTEGGTLDDMGGAPRVTRCQIIFFQRTEDDDHLSRFADFETLKRTGEIQTFVHPLTGGYQARIRDFSFSVSAEPRDTITVDCSFVEDSVEPAIFDIGAGAPTFSAEQDVAAVSAELDAAVLEVETTEDLQGIGTPIDLTVGADALALVTEWVENTEKSIDDIRLELDNMRSEIDAEMERLECNLKVTRWPILRSLVELDGAVTRAAAVFTDRTPRIVEIIVKAPVNLLTLITRRFGTAGLDERMAEILRLNSIPNPARIEAGTVIRATAPGNA